MGHAWPRSLSFSPLLRLLLQGSRLRARKGRGKIIPGVVNLLPWTLTAPHPHSGLCSLTATPEGACCGLLFWDGHRLVGLQHRGRSVLHLGDQTSCVNGTGDRRTVLVSLLTPRVQPGETRPPRCTVRNGPGPLCPVPLERGRVVTGLHVQPGRKADACPPDVTPAPPSRPRRAVGAACPAGCPSPFLPQDVPVLL